MNRLNTLGICTAIFAVLGPLAGGLFFFACMVQGSTDPSLSDLFSPGMSLIYVFLFFGAYLLGSIPAAATGFVFGLIASRGPFGRLQCTLLGAALGFLACSLFELALNVIHGGPIAWDWIFPLSGAFSGSLCGLSCRLLSVGPNNSFKPKPLRGSA
ncbi:hypothetical protein [Pseudoxanthomonas wuyuanensis]|uniref:hypothetical protein n=1 Tax=Pseudoxanthomonas wuyuanensis TaxID=1073196 RepID=UPI0011445A3B|nr:hypothetical protein [Pseudoxanthomonas wuyuanensis]